MSTEILIETLTDCVIGDCVVTKVISIRPNPELRARLEYLAKATDRDLTWFVVRALEAQLPEFEKELELQLKALKIVRKEQGQEGTRARSLPPLMVESEKAFLNEPRTEKKSGTRYKPATE